MRKDKISKFRIVFVLTYAFLAVILGWNSFHSRPQKVEVAAQFHQTIWNNLSVQGKSGTSEEPLLTIHGARVLFPAMMQIPQYAGLSTEKSFSLLRLLTGFVALILMHWFLLHWFTDELAFCGTLFVAATMPITFGQWFELPTDYPEMIVFTIGIWAIFRSKWWVLCLVTFIGTFNRESTAVLPFFAFFVLFDLKNFKWLIPVAAAGFSWLIPLLALRWWVGAMEAHGYGQGIAHNSQGLLELFSNPHPYNNYLFWFYMFGTFWVLPYLRWKEQPEFFKRLLIAVPIMVVVYLLVGGYLDEPRELVHIYPVLVPASLIALFPNSFRTRIILDFDKTNTGSS